MKRSARMSGGRLVALRLRNEVEGLCARARPADEIALALRAAGAANELQLLRCLDSLRRGLDAEDRAELGNRPDDRLALLARNAVEDERTIDLDLVEREASQIAQGRIARAEIIHRNSRTEGAKLVKGADGGLVLSQQHRFRDFQFKAMSR